MFDISRSNVPLKRISNTARFDRVSVLKLDRCTGADTTVKAWKGSRNGRRTQPGVLYLGSSFNLRARRGKLKPSARQLALVWCFYTSVEDCSLEPADNGGMLR